MLLSFRQPQLASCTLPINGFWSVLALLLLWRLLQLVFADLPLFYDEAYYHLWALTPDWGYYSKPPMVAWLIAVTTHVFDSHEEWAVRLAAPLCYFFTSLVVYQIAKRLFDQGSARYAALIFYTMPLVHFNSLFITTDAPLMLFWALTLWLFVIASQRQKIHWWLLAGITGGLGLLSKYTMGVLAIGIVLAVLMNNKQRSLLIHPAIWLTAGIAAAIFLPNLLWNAEHNWISFQHTSEISQLNKSLFHLDKFAEFFAGQLLTFGLVAFPILLYLLRRFPKDDASWLLWLVCIAMLGTISLQALLARAHINWAAAAYVSGSVLVGHFLYSRARHKILLSIVLINLLLGGAFYYYPQVQNLLGIQASRNNTPYHRVSGWKDIMHQLPAELPAPAQHYWWISDSRKLLSYGHFYLSDFTQQQLVSVAGFNPDAHIDHHFDLVHPLAHADSTQPWLFISEKPRQFAGCFQQFTLLKKFEQPVYTDVTREIYLYQVSGFNGYEHCQKTL